MVQGLASQGSHSTRALRLSVTTRTRGGVSYRIAAAETRAVPSERLQSHGTVRVNDRLQADQERCLFSVVINYTLVFNELLVII